MSTPHTGAADFTAAPDCAACHSAHAAQNVALLSATPPQAALCYTCHSGGDAFDVQNPFEAAPANDGSTDSYYAHPVAATSASDHVLAGPGEFANRLERHAVCADCHNPHDATSTRPAQTTTGWTVPGDVAGASGLRVTNGTSGSVPTLAALDRAQGERLTYEYQLCLACHSSWTTLPTRSSDHPSWWALDKAVEFNPANAAYHPVEAAGRNQSTQMAASLAGTSPFKAWDYTIESTIRCTSCHGDPSTVNQTASASPKRPSADGYEAAHASQNRGLLTAPYRDRILKPAGESYQPGDFALCYLCHSERPFVDPNENPSAPDTAFSLHGKHISALQTVAEGGTAIDTPGAGEGLAICAECHFRIHSTAIAYQAGDLGPVARSNAAGGLVNFAPNVVGLGTKPPLWTQPSGAGTGSCALTCHGFTHLAADTEYSTAPGTSFVAVQTTAPAGVALQFADATRYIPSSGGATWAWDFGDGTTSTLRNPSHAYAIAGSYSVSLTVTRTSDGLSATMIRADYITVTP